MDSAEPNGLIKYAAEVDILSTLSPGSRSMAISALDKILSKWKAIDALSQALCCTLPGFVAFPDAAFDRLEALILLVYNSITRERQTPPSQKVSSRLNTLRELGPIEFTICGLSLNEKTIDRMHKDVFTTIISEAKSATSKVKPALIRDKRVEQAVQRAGVPEFTTSKSLRFDELYNWALTDRTRIHGYIPALTPLLSLLSKSRMCGVFSIGRK